MERRIVRTADGSMTIQLPGWQEQYHSMHGAIRESYHVFIHQGLFQFTGRGLDLLEVGFGTGLNALITLLEAPSRSLKVNYTALEAYPLEESEWGSLGYGSSFPEHGDVQGHFEKLHRVPWGRLAPVTGGFSLQKLEQDLLQFTPGPDFDLVYFDAFGARVQPELWTEEVFGKMYAALRPGGYLVTYAAKGSVRRAMEAVGFRTERLPGPPGKREMLRAGK